VTLTSVLVTGASRGIGLATATALLSRGTTVTLVSRTPPPPSDKNRHPECCDDPRGQRNTSGDNFRHLLMDLAEEGRAEEAVERAAEMMGGIDGLVCCAGMVRRAGIEGVTREDLGAQMELNLEAAIFAAKRFAAIRRGAGGGGAIVNVASTLGVRPVADAIAYSASKAALIAATRAMALELAPDGIRVNAVAPGLIDTEMIAGRRREELARLHPLGRLGTPEDVAAAILYLLDAPFVTGTVHAVDGGLLL
jgi:3-oxoacyl-[acyl-carrier protein] reductase